MAFTEDDFRLIGNSEHRGMSARQFIENRLTILYGPNSLAIRALDLVCAEMCVKKGFMRDDGQDYFNHCIEVANTIMSFGIKEEFAVCAALLHDMIEDVIGCTYEYLTTIFGKEVADLVLLLTKKKGVDYKQAENIIEYLKAISKDPWAAAIKTADRMHNMMTLSEKGVESRYKKAIETETYYINFFKYCGKTYQRYTNLFYSARVEVQSLIFEIKDSYQEIQKRQREIDELKTENAELKEKIKELEAGTNAKARK